MIWIKNVFINHMRTPMGLCEDFLVTWHAESGRRNTMLGRYRLIIYDESGVCLDTGIKSGGNFAAVKLESFSARSLHKYYVKVRIWDEQEQNSEWSAPEAFFTGILDPDEWEASFITAETKDDAEKSASEYVYKRISVKAAVRRVTVCASALGLYTLYINGKRRTETELAPGWTSYHKHLLYQTYDVTDTVACGENEIGLLVGAGWYKGVMGPYLQRNHYGVLTAALCQIRVEYEDGTTEVFGTDESWCAKEGPVTFSEIYDGEIFDARKNGICRCAEEVKELPVRRLDVDKCILWAQPGGWVRVMETIRPVRIFTTPKGETVADMGKNIAGRPEIRAKACRGAKFELQCFEILDNDGNVYTDNLRTAKQTIIYYSRDDSEFVYTPHFTFQGFRYIYVKSWPGGLTAESIRGQVLYSSMEQTGYFETSDTMLNRLNENILQSLKGNFVDVPMDCPQRDERMGWTGDAQIFCSTACFLMDTYSFYRKWLVDLRCDQKENGGIPHVIPDIVTGTEVRGFLRQGTDSAAAWADAATLIPWKLYTVYGDESIIFEQYASMKKWVDFMRKRARGAVWSYKLQFGDWVALDAQEGSYFGATPNEYVSAVYYLVSTQILYRAAQVVGEETDYCTYQKLYEKNLEDFRRRYFTEEGRLNIDTQTAVVLALYFKLAPKEYTAGLVEQLKNLLDKYKGHLVTGFVGTPYICFALSENGAEKGAYDLLKREDMPSWLYQITKGATTIWEHWDGLKEDGTLWDPHMNSFNHYAYGAIGDWMYKVLLGVREDSDAPGYRHFSVCPYIPENLEHVKGSYTSVYGEIAVSWKQREGKVYLDVLIPVNTTADIGLHNIGIQDKNVGSGTYEFVYSLEGRE